MANAAPSDVYAEQLLQCCQGLPLWAPEPTKHGEVLVGDVGYLDDGAFYRLFNAVRPADDEVNARYGVPEGFKPIELNTYGINVREAAIPDGPLCSKSVTSEKAAAKVEIHGAGGSFNLECKDHQGACLVLKEAADREILQKNTKVPDYMTRFYPSWHTFARDRCHMDLDKEDIILVCGWVKTTEWAVAAFTHGRCAVEVKFDAELASYGTASFSYSHAHEVTTPYFHRSGPLRVRHDNHQQDAHRGKGKGKNKNHHEDGKHPHKKDQCVFLHYYKLKQRRLLAPKVIKAAAEPRELNYAPDEHDDDAAITAADGDETMEEFIVEQVPTHQKPYDPVGFVLDYILENSNAEIAIANIQDVFDVHEGNGISSNIPEFLATVRPRIQVDENGVGTLSLDTPVSPVTSDENTSAMNASADAVEGPLDFDSPHHSAAERQQSTSDPSAAVVSEPNLISESLVEGRSQSPLGDDAEEATEKSIIVNSPNVIMLADGAEGVCSLAFAPNGEYFASGSEDSRIVIWDTVTGRQVGECLDHTDMICSLAFSPNSKELVSGSRDNSAIIWNVATGVARAILEGHTGFVEWVNYSPNGRIIASASVDFTIRLWDAIAGTVYAILEGHKAMILQTAFSPNSARLVSASADCTARIWDATTGDMLAVLSGHRGVIYSLSFSPDSRRLVTGSDDGTSTVWGVEGGVELLTLREHQGSVWQAVFSPDGSQILSVASDKTVKTCDSFSGDQLAALEVGDQLLSTAIFSPDTKRVCTSTEDNVVRVWNTSTGVSLAPLEGHEDNITHLRFSPDGRRLVTSDDNAIRIWNLGRLAVA